MDAGNTKIIAGNGGVDTGTGILRAVMGKYNGTDYGFRVWDGTNTFVELSSNGTNKISNWNITPTTLYNTGSNGGLIMDATGQKYVVTTGSNADSEIIVMGDLDGSDNFGIRGYNTAGVELFKLGMLGNTIAGWTIATDKIGKGQVSMSYADTAFIVNQGAYNKVRMGLLNGKFGLSGGEYGFILGNGTGDSAATDVLVELSDNRNYIAGWTLTTGSFSSAGGTAILGGVGYLSLGQGTIGYAQTGAWMEGTNSGRLSLVGATGKML